LPSHPVEATLSWNIGEGVMTTRLVAKTGLPRCTTFARSLIGIVLGSIGLAASPAPAHADSGPQQVLYLFPGVTDNGGNGGSGVATAIHCFTFSPGSETMQFIVRRFDGTVVANSTLVVTQFHTYTIVTHINEVYISDLVLFTGTVAQGVVGISATSSNIVCTAQVIDASATVPNGIDLHGTRFNPIPGSQE
jgi:hypothetical protein